MHVIRIPASLRVGRCHVAVPAAVTTVEDDGAVVTDAAIGLIDLNDLWVRPVTGPEKPSPAADLRRWFVIRQPVTSSR